MIILNVNMIQRVWTIFSTVFILVCIVSCIFVFIYFYIVVETLIYLSSKIMGRRFHYWPRTLQRSIHHYLIMLDRDTT